MHRRRYHKKSAKRLALILTVGILMTAVFAGSVSVVSRADEVSDLKKSIEQKEKEIQNAQNQKKSLQTGLTDVKKVIAGLEQTKKDLAAYVNELDTSLVAAQAKITELTDLITAKEVEIAETKVELAEAIAMEEDQYEAMVVRIKNMYERGDSFYIETIFSAQSFGEMLNRADYIERLTASDKRLFEGFQATREYVEVCKAQLETEQELLEEARVNVEEEKASLEALIAQKEADIKAYEADISNREQLIKEYEAEIAAQDAEIKELEAAHKAAQEALARANGTKKSYDGGVFAWPAPSFTRISDEYGWRMHPTLHVEKFHNGLDLAAPGGSPILAAYDGTVVAAAYSSSMGNYIMIDHGDNLYTIYMHASALYVSSGQNVVKGQKIAAVGTTGRSTGNHLHFGVRLNGEYVSPWNYLK